RTPSCGSPSRMSPRDRCTSRSASRNPPGISSTSCGMAEVVVREARPEDDPVVGEILVAAYLTRYAQKMPEVVLTERRIAELRDGEVGAAAVEAIAHLRNGGGARGAGGRAGLEVALAGGARGERRVAVVDARFAAQTRRPVRAARRHGKRGVVLVADLADDL